MPTTTNKPKKPKTRKVATKRPKKPMVKKKQPMKKTMKRGLVGGGALVFAGGSYGLHRFLKSKKCNDLMDSLVDAKEAHDFSRRSVLQLLQSKKLEQAEPFNARMNKQKEAIDALEERIRKECAKK